MSELYLKIIQKINQGIGELINTYKEDLAEVNHETIEYKLIQAKIEALEELRSDLNEPFFFVDVTGEVQQSLNVIETKNIINSMGNKSF